MNGEPVHPIDAAGAATLLGGIAVIAFPSGVLSFLQLAAVTVATMAGLFALGRNVPPTGWLSPFRLMSPFSPKRKTVGAPDEIQAMARALWRWRRPMPGGPPLPQAIVRSLRSLIREALFQHGVAPGSVVGVQFGVHDEVSPNQHLINTRNPPVLSPITMAILRTEAENRPVWFPPFPPNPRVVAAAIHEALDDVEAILGSRGVTVHGGLIPDTSLLPEDPNG